MPSEDRLSGSTAVGERARRALAALEGPVEDFRSAVGRAVDEVRARLAAGAQPVGGEGAADRLGPLARGRIDADRFAALFGADEVLDPDALSAMRSALEVLAGMDAAGDDLFLRRLGPEEELGEAVGTTLGRLGRAFGAARTAELARTGRLASVSREGWLAAFPPKMWNRAERGIAPPLVLELAGDALRPASLADVLDGGQKLALVVEGSAPPAPLVRLVTPGVLVLQTEDPAELELLAGHDGPAVAAVYPEGAGAASFLHDPAAGERLSERLAVRELPAAEGLRPVGPITAFRQAEELRQLAALAEAAAAAPAPLENGGGSAPAAGGIDEHPADRLAAWLLRQANLPDPGRG